MSEDERVQDNFKKMAEACDALVKKLENIEKEISKRVKEEESDLDKARTNYDLSFKKLLNDMKLKRKKDGLTLDGLSEKLSVSSAYISQLERGLKNNVSYSLGKKIEEYLKE